ncbi:MAG: hypothetical protein WDA18_09960 [Candidatus Ratteibacteria bacterium]
MKDAELLKREIIENAHSYAEEKSIPYYESRGKAKVVMFELYDNGKDHGNFLSASFNRILSHIEWKKRLEKQHQQKKALPEDRQKKAKELDSCNSSDALLMNIFCYPGITKRLKLSGLFGDYDLQEPEFGINGKVPFKDGKYDTTEIDMKIGNVLVEAKLTEKDFTEKRKTHLSTYQNFEDIFDIFKLPQNNINYLHYQLIRNILAAYAHKISFFLICDERRPDLVKFFDDVRVCIKSESLKKRCHLLFWQQIASIVPVDLQEFLKVKYGILSKDFTKNWAGSLGV